MNRVVRAPGGVLALRSGQPLDLVATLWDWPMGLDTARLRRRLLDLLRTLED